MIIKGKKELDNNMIDSLTFDYDEIRVVSYKNIDYKKTMENGTITNRLKGMSNTKKRSEILELFLSSDIITTIYNSTQFNRYVTIYTKYGRILNIKEEYTDLLNMVNIKYENDRFNALLGKNYDIYDIKQNDNKRNYNVFRIGERKIFSVNLTDKDNNSFITEMLDFIVKGNEVEKRVYEKKNANGKITGTYIYYLVKDSNKIITCDQAYKKYIEEYIKQHMAVIEEANKRQLKLEGF